MWLARLLAVLTIFAATAAPAHADTRATVIGTSQTGSMLTLYELGTGPKRVLILGGQHGGPEANTVELVNRVLGYFADNPDAIPAGVELDILPVANPDGLAGGIRQFADGVDPDRNWGGSDWRPDAFDSNAVFRVGLGGPEPFSEPETPGFRGELPQRGRVHVWDTRRPGERIRGGERIQLAAARRERPAQSIAVPGDGQHERVDARDGDLLDSRRAHHTIERRIGEKPGRPHRDAGGAVGKCDLS
jgi:hypothetical protein